ncbi:MAG: HNH endonuclease [Chloroflexaceae bacterium]
MIRIRLTLDGKVRLHVDHIIPISQGGTDEKSNLRVLCSACNQGRANIQTPTEDARNILARIRRASRAVQREVYDALKKTFGE